MPPEPKDIEEAIATILDADASVRAAVPDAISQRDLVRRVMNFANTGRPEGLPGARVLTQGGQSFLVMTPEQDALRAELWKDLSAIVKGELSAPAVARLLKRARLVSVRHYEIEQKVLVPLERHFVKDLGALVADVLLRVRSDPELQKDVRQCRLPGCWRFFLASDQVKDPSAPGRRRHRYCSPEHMNLAQTPGAISTAKWRKKHQ